MVSIITVNYNGGKDTLELAESFRQFEDYPYEFIVVDNASPNGDGERLEKALGDSARVIRSDKNLGFAGANNLGYRAAKGDYILYINNDIIITAPVLKALVERLRQDTRIGAVSPKIKYAYRQDTIQYAGYESAHPIRASYQLVGVYQTDRAAFDQSKRTDAIHGACVMTSRKVIEKAGAMTEVYFLFYEELDWSLQLHRHGYETWYEPAATVFHKESMTIKRGSPQRLYYLTRSRMLFVRRNREGLSFFLSIMYQLTIAIPKNIFQHLLRRDWASLSALIRGSFHGLTNTTCLN
ncbi:MAG: glycosyltransferase family 2 protein [Parabacteroides sp.]|nr:glycosyltransferase family 2 protein [Parabacteroides sp.]